jgi:hypothetical protein
MGGKMHRILGLVLVLTSVVVFSAAISVAGASAKFTFTDEILDNGHLVFNFEEGSMKRFASVDYRLDATATVSSPNFAQLYGGLQASVTLPPDDKGRVGGSLTLSDVSLISPQPCTCGPLHVEYFDMTLTNLTTGHVYRLESISRDYP